MNMIKSRIVVISIVAFVAIRGAHPEEIDAVDFGQNFARHFEAYLTANFEDADLRNVRNVMLEDGGENIKLKGFSPKAEGRLCLKCYSTISTILWYNNTYGLENVETAKEFLKKLCHYLQIDKGRICDGNVEAYYDTIKYILSKKQNASAAEACGILLQGFYCMKEEMPYEEIPVEKPVLIGSKKYFSNSTGTLKILQFSDFHYDPKYTAGSSATCEEWICCRGPELPFCDPGRAGAWGDYRRCDSPSYQVENLIKEAARRHKDIDMIYMTGDYAHHFAWDKTFDELLHSVEFVTRLIKLYFPEVPVFPVLGNHDSYPDNLYSPDYVQNRYLSSIQVYEHLSNFWKDWLPDDALQTFRKGGYYTTLLRPNLRLIALNNNVCFTANLWLLLDNFFYRDQLEWLHSVLNSSSLADEKVHIIAHVPANDKHCYYTWTKEYKRIIERYTHVISAQLNGHSHLDEFVVNYAEEDPSVALSVAWNGGSGTNFPNVNSNYKILYVNDENYELIDFETWIFNLTEANSDVSKDPVWFKEYSFKSYFNLTDLSPDSVDSLVTRMATDKELLEKYWRITVKQSDDALAAGCDSKCLAKVWADITRTYFNNEKNIKINS